MQMTENKQQFRKKYREIRKKITNKSEKDEKILNRLKQSGIYNNCTSAFVYVSAGIEIDTIKLIESLLKDGKKVAVPLCNTANCTMKFYYISSLSDLSSGAYGIMEPNADKCKQAVAEKTTVCIVPGLAFDKNGYRIGFGKGYYDRFLSSFENEAVGLCYEECLCENIPYDEFDKRVSVIVTENNIYKCKK